MRVRTTAVVTLCPMILVLGLTPADAGLTGAGAHHHNTVAYSTIFVANRGNDSITEYAPHSNGNVKPIAQIVGSNTTLHRPTAVALTATGSLWVSNETNDSLVRFAVGADGNIAPVQTIKGAHTGIRNPTGIAVATDGSLWVSNAESDSIEHFAADATGNAQPLAVITGPTTQLEHPQGISLTSDGRHVWVIDSEALREFPVTANGDPVQSNVFRGPPSGLDGSTDGVWVDPFGNVWAGVVGALEYFPGQDTGAIPPARIRGPKTRLQAPESIAGSAHGHLWVADPSAKAVSEYSAIPPNHAAPVRRIHGSQTGLKQPWGVVLFGKRSGPPRHLTGHITGRHVHLAWQAPTHVYGGIEGYTVEIERGNRGWPTPDGVGAPTQTTFALGHTGHYQFRVLAVSGFGVSTPSNSVSVTFHQ